MGLSMSNCVCPMKFKKALADDPEDVKEDIQNLVGNQLTAISAMRVIGAIQNRVGEQIQWPSPLPSEWDELSEILLNTAQDALHKKQERLNAQVARDIDVLIQREDATTDAVNCVCCLPFHKAHVLHLTKRPISRLNSSSTVSRMLFIPHNYWTAGIMKMLWKMSCLIWMPPRKHCAPPGDKANSTASTKMLHGLQTLACCTHCLR